MKAARDFRRIIADHSQPASCRVKKKWAVYTYMRHILIIDHKDSLVVVAFHCGFRMRSRDRGCGALKPKPVAIGTKCWFHCPSVGLESKTCSKMK